jgi:hypothetical protein
VLLCSWCIASKNKDQQRSNAHDHRLTRGPAHHKSVHPYPPRELTSDFLNLSLKFTPTRSPRTWSVGERPPPWYFTKKMSTRGRPRKATKASPSYTGMSPLTVRALTRALRPNPHDHRLTRGLAHHKSVHPY